MNILGLIGPSNAGKDTFSSFVKEIVEEKGGTVAIKSLAAPVYETCAFLLSDFKGKAYYDKHVEEKHTPLTSCGKTPKEVLVTVGEGLKALDPFIWIKKLEASLPDTNLLIVPDVRFPAEANALKVRGCKFIRISRPGHEIYFPMDEHLRDYRGDRHVVNSFDLNNLRNLAEEAVSELFLV